MKHIFLFVLAMSFNTSTALAQVFFHKKIDVGFLSGLWSEARQQDLLTNLNAGLEGCWRSTKLSPKGYGGGWQRKEAAVVFEPQAFPIPAHGAIPIRIPGVEADSRIYILNLEGEILHEARLTNPETLLDIQMLEMGYYIVKYEGGDTSWKLPLIKQ
jgi:hypothetical protein